MSKIIFDSGISLDGFFAGDNRSPGNPIGGVSGKFTSGCLNKKHFGNNKVGHLPGTSKNDGHGLNNPYYDYRIEAAIKLLKMG